MEIEIGNVVRVGGEQYLVRSLENGVHGVRVTDEELEADDDLGGRRTLYLGTTDSLESEGAQVVALGCDGGVNKVASTSRQFSLRVEGEPYRNVSGTDLEDAALEHVLGGDWGDVGAVVEVLCEEGGTVRVLVTCVDRYGQASKVEVA